MKTFSFKDAIQEIEALKSKNNFLEIACKQVVEEYDKLKEENKQLDATCNEVISEYAKLEKTNERMLNDLVKYEKEIQFLKQRNKELRQKTWYGVFEENLKLAEEIKQYQATLQAVETFIASFQNERR